MSGWSELIFGSMYCGKSEELIRRLKRVHIAGKKYQLFKPSIDTRYDETHVSTHEYSEVKKRMETILELRFNNGVDIDPQNLIHELSKQFSGSMKAIIVSNSDELLQNIEEDAEVIGIDEVQFFDEKLIPIIDQLAHNGKRVIMAGLDMYSSGEPFGIVPILACKAKYVDKLHAVCVECGKDAYISYKIDNDIDNIKSTVDVGSVGKYIALCQTCSRDRKEKNNKRNYPNL